MFYCCGGDGGLTVSRSSTDVVAVVIEDIVSVSRGPSTSCID